MVIHPCFGKKANVYVLDPSDCEAYFVCGSGSNGGHFKCSGGRRFNPDEDICELREENPDLIRAACPTWE